MKFATLENLSSSGALGATKEAVDENKELEDIADGNAKIIKGIAEIDAISGGVEKALDGVSNIHKLLDAANATREEGAMSDKEAKLLAVTHEGILRTLGYKDIKIEMCSMESFTNKQTSLAATNATLEAMAAAAGSVTSKLVASLKAMAKSIYEFLVNLLRSSSALEKFIKTDIKRLEQIRSPKMKKESFEHGAQALSIDGKADYSTAMKLLEGADHLIVSSTRLANAAKEGLTEEEAKEAIRAAVNNITVLPADRTVHLREEEGAFKVEYKAGTRFAESAKALTLEEAKRLAQKALSTVKSLREFEKSMSLIRDAINRVIDLLQTGKDAVLSVAGGKESRDTHRESYDARLKARQIKVMIDQAGNKFPVFAFKAIKAVTDYIRQSARNMESESKV